MTPVIPRAAAAVLLVRSGAVVPLEVFMIRRHKTMRFLGGYYAFPGGKVDEADAAPAAFARCRGLGPEAAARLFPELDGLSPLAFWVAAARELLEEVGVLVAAGEDGRPVDVRDADTAARVEGVRAALLAGSAPLSDLLARERWYLDLERFRYLSHFITPASSPIRFTARFFLVPLPAGQDARHGDEEASEGLWIDPLEGYRRFRQGEMPMADPGDSGLGYLSAFESVDALWAAQGDGRHKFHGILDRFHAAGVRTRPDGSG